MFEVAVVGDCWQYFWLYIICHCGSTPGSTEGEQHFWQIWQRTNTIPVYNFCICVCQHHCGVTTYKYGKGQIQYSSVFVSVFVFVTAQHHYDDESRATFQTNLVGDLLRDRRTSVMVPPKPWSDSAWMINYFYNYNYNNMLFPWSMIILLIFWNSHIAYNLCNIQR